MPDARKKKAGTRSTLPKTPTGISGFDEITFGGLPKARPTLICGGPGCGKTLFAMEFLLRGATEFGEPGVMIAFEETAADLSQNVRSLGFDLDKLIADKKVLVDYVHIDRSEIEETGEYDLEGLFLRLGFAIDAIGAKRVVLDTVEALFSAFSNPAILRSELRRLFRWLKEKKVTAIITGERGEGNLTRQGLEEYVSDCVIFLDHRTRDDVSTRRMRIVKYRGTSHGTNEYPFLIDETGISVLPLTSLGLDHVASRERISSGVSELDSMLAGEGFFRGSSILVSGPAGTGKTTFAVSFADAACRRGDRCLFLAFEESPHQLVRNMRSIGLDLGARLKEGRLRIESRRATSQGLEMHLVQLHKLVEEHDPAVVIIDPISAFANAASEGEVGSWTLRVVDYLKARGVTALLAHTADSRQSGETDRVFSLIDTWLDLDNIDGQNGARRALRIVKSRGMDHSNQVREFVFSRHGVKFVEEEARDRPKGTKRKREKKGR
jgi:circadian clock protein KaiC